MRVYLMQGRSSVTRGLVTWKVEGSPDFKGVHWPGPGSVSYISARIVAGHGHPKSEMRPAKTPTA